MNMQNGIKVQGEFFSILDKNVVRHRGAGTGGAGGAIAPPIFASLV